MCTVPARFTCTICNEYIQITINLEEVCLDGSREFQREIGFKLDPFREEAVVLSLYKIVENILTSSRIKMDEVKLRRDPWPGLMTFQERP